MSCQTNVGHCARHEVPDVGFDCRVPQLKYARKNEEFELRRAFLKLDKNNDNKIDAEELAAFFSSLGHKVKKVHSCMSQVDVVSALRHAEHSSPRVASAPDRRASV